MIWLKVDRLPGDRDPKPVWLWSSMTGEDIDVRRQRLDVQLVRQRPLRRRPPPSGAAVRPRPTAEDGLGRYTDELGMAQHR
nr:hypothetical protein [Streptomyces sp. T21Q-yed]